MSMVLPTMYRATQNRDTPNLPFAQTTSPTMFRDMQNPDTPNLPFAQGFSTSEKNYVLLSLGKLNQNVGTNSRNLVQMGKDMTKIGQDNIWFGKKITELENRPMGTTTHDHVFERVHPKQTQQLIKMGKDMTDLGNSLSSAKLHRDSIEGKVELGNTQRAEIHSNLRDLGTAVSDVSSGLESHKLGHGGNGGGNGNGCDTWNIMCHIDNLKAQIGGAALLGGAAIVGYILLKKRLKL